MHAGASCEHSDQGVNLGEFGSPEECAPVAAEQGCGMFMVSSAYPVWGCRCCHQRTGDHALWNIYSTTTPEAACDDSKCTSPDGQGGTDCCASDAWGEPKTCADGYLPVETGGGYLNCEYTCCPITTCSR